MYVCMSTFSPSSAARIPRKLLAAICIQTHRYIQSRLVGRVRTVSNTLYQDKKSVADKKLSSHWLLTLF